MHGDPNPSDPLVGTVVDERFEIIGRLGAGGMAVVYAARQIGTELDVAIKIMNVALTGDALTRFHREALALERLEHPNIVKVLEFGTMRDGRLYIVTELLCGQTLAEILEQGAIETRRALNILRQICAALDYVHASGAIHRDLKPANVFVCQRGSEDLVKVIDFGIARFAQQTIVTASGMILGTPAFMSPEQAQGKKLDPRSDLYSFGLIAYQCFAGVPPFASKTPVGFLFKHINEAPRSIQELLRPGTISEPLAAMIMQLLSKDPGERPASASRFLAMLDREAGGATKNVKRNLAVQSTRGSGLFAAGDTLLSRTTVVQRSLGVGAIVAGMVAVTGLVAAVVPSPERVVILAEPSPEVVAEQQPDREAIAKYVLAHCSGSSRFESESESEFEEDWDQQTKRSLPLTGVVLDRDGDPIAGVELEITGAMVWREFPDGSRHGTGGGILLRAISGSDGKFRFLVEPGNWELRAKKKGYLRTEQNIRHGKNKRAKAKIILEEAFALRGRVVDWQERPLVGWCISAFGTGGIDQPDIDPVATDDQGRFVLVGADDRTYNLRAAGLWTDSLVHNIFGVEARAGTGDVIFRLARQAAVSGRVRFEGASPPGTFKVCAPFVECQEFGGRSGEYRLSAVVAANVSISFTAPGFQSTRGTIDLTRASTASLDVTMQAGVDETQLTVQIVDSESGSPIEGAELRSSEMVGAAPMVTGPAGRLSWARQSFGPEALVISKPGFAQKIHRLELDSPRNPVVIVLDRGLPIRGKVSVPPSCKTSVSLTPVEPESIEATIVRSLAGFEAVHSDGTFSIQAPKAGRSIVELHCNRRSSFVTQWIEVEVPVGGLHDLAMHIPSGDSVIKVLHAPLGRGVSISLTSLRSAGEKFSYSLSRIDGSQRSVFELLPEGQYRVDYWKDQNRTTREITLGSSVSEIVDMR